MGYDCKLYIVSKNSNPKEKIGRKKYCYASVIASVELCGMSNKYHNTILSKARPSGCYIYGSDGNTRITEDCYGTNLKEINLKKLIKFLKEDLKESHYRRIPPALAILESFVKNKEDWKYSNIKVLHYGH